MATARSSTPAIARPRTRRSSARGRVAVFGIGALAILIGIAYLVARETSLFAVRSVDVVGAPLDLERSVVAALGRFEGQSLVAVSTSEVDRVVEAIPSVRSASVDRDFPHTLRIEVRPERAVAVVRRDDEAWLVSASGRVLQRLEPGVLLPLPRVWIGRESGDIAPGDVLLEEQGAVAVKALASIPADFPQRVESAAGDPDSLTLVLAGKTELRLGEPIEIREKLESAAAVIEQLGRAQARDLAYLDVSLPTRPVGAQKSQVETSA
jgi:cell division protein FtsQ